MGAGSVFGTAEKVFTDGICYLFILLGYPISKIFIAKYICPRLFEFKDMISMGEIMGSFYGKSGQIITGIAGIFLSLGFISAQISAIGYLFYFLIGIPHFYGIIIGTFILIIYSSYGGIKSIIRTNSVQFIILSVGFLLISYTALKNIEAIREYSPHAVSKFSKITSPNLSVLKEISLFLVFCLPFVGPAFVQRMLMTKDVSQAKKAVYITGGLETIFYCIFASLGLFAFILKPTLDPNLIIPFIIDYQPIFIKGICVAGMFAVVMSSADAEMNVSSISLVHDVLNPFLSIISSKDLQKFELITLRSAVFLFGFIAAIISTSCKSIFDVIIGVLDFWGPVVLIPFFSGILGLQASTKTFLYSVVAGIITVLIWNLFIQTDIHLIESLVPGVLANIVVFFVSHYTEQIRTPKLIQT